MNTPKLDWSMPIQTRDGRKAELLCDDLRAPHSHAVKITDEDGDKWVGLYDESGATLWSKNEPFIINVPPQMVKKSGWVVLRKNHEGEIKACRTVSPTKELAEQHAKFVWGGLDMNIIATVEIHWEEPA